MQVAGGTGKSRGQTVATGGAGGQPVADGVLDVRKAVAAGGQRGAVHQHQAPRSGGMLDPPPSGRGPDSETTSSGTSTCCSCFNPLRVGAPIPRYRKSYALAEIAKFQSPSRRGTDSELVITAHIEFIVDEFQSPSRRAPDSEARTCSLTVQVRSSFNPLRVGAPIPIRRNAAANTNA